MLNTLEHKGLVIKLANYYSNAANQYSNVDIEDLIQEGWLAILIKSDDYDPDRGSISTFLFPWIKDAMYKFLRRRSVVRRPVSYNKGLKLSNYRIPCCEYNGDFHGLTSPSPEIEIESHQNVREKMEVYYNIFKNRTYKSEKYYGIEWALSLEEDERTISQ